jgi:endonuclease/exonuclease/phosphatase family metal-dependent hydrolase
MIYKACSFNVACRDISSLKHLLDTQEFAACDVVLIQELETGIRVRVGEVVSSHVGDFVLYFLSTRQTTTGSHGIAIATKHKVRLVESFPLPEYSLVFRSRERFVLSAVIELVDQELQILNLHLDTRLNISDRLGQVSTALSVCRQPVWVMGGDFNSLPFKYWQNLIPFAYEDQTKILREHISVKLNAGYVTPDKPTFKLGPLGAFPDQIYFKGLRLEDHWVADWCQM